MSQRLMANNADAPETPEFIKQRGGKLLVTPDGADGPTTLQYLNAILEIQQGMLVELRTISYFIQQGLNVSDELDDIRAANANAPTQF